MHKYVYEYVFERCKIVGYESYTLDSQGEAPIKIGITFAFENYYRKDLNEPITYRENEESNGTVNDIGKINPQLNQGGSDGHFQTGGSKAEDAYRNALANANRNAMAEKRDREPQLSNQGNNSQANAYDAYSRAIAEKRNEENRNREARGLSREPQLQR